MGRKPLPWWTVEVIHTHSYPYYVKGKDRDDARNRAWKAHRSDQQVKEYVVMKVRKGRRKD